MHETQHARRVTGLAAALALWAAIVAPVGADDIRVELVARSIQPGEVVRLDIRCACGERAPVASFLDGDVQLTETPDGRWQGLIGLDIDLKPGTYPLVVNDPDASNGSPQVTPVVVEAKKFRTRTLTVAPEFVDPPPDVLERILREAKAIDAVLKVRTPRQWDGPVALPLRTQPSQNFGSRSVFNGEPRSPHAGIDFGRSAGATVRSPARGTVAMAENLFFTGNTIIIDHGDGLYSLYAHLASMSVSVGDHVQPGAGLGIVGATGRATGPHLHWGVRLTGARVDPLSLVAATTQ